MKFLLNSTYSLVLASISGAFLSACGGGGADGSAQTSASIPASPEVSSTAASLTAVPGLPPSLQPSVAEVVTDVKLDNLVGTTQTNVPVTFGQVFARGAVLTTNSLIGKLADGTSIPLQMDIKATHPDGSVRHAVISAVLPSMAANESRTINIAKKAAVAQVAAATPSSLISAGFTSSVNLTVDGQLYSVSADDLLKTTTAKTWLAGSVANEWIVSAPLKTAQGTEHPHLSARFAVRWYSAIKKARVDMTVENDWAYEASPRNFTYSAQVLVGGQKVFDQASLTHYHHARWRKTFWWGEAPQVHIRHNTKYLIASRAVPNYDQSVVVSEDALAALRASWTASNIAPMGVGIAAPYMPMTGGRQDIGILPAWSALYLLSMDKRAKDVMLGVADLAGSYSSHFRDKGTDRPVSLVDYPYMTVLGREDDTMNPVTRKREAFPSCPSAEACATPYTHDSSHQPSLAYLPYLVTGDYFYLEELQFWSMWNVFSSNPGYRENIKGLLLPDQVRGQAWSLRTLSQAAYITPDADPLKAHFEGFLSNNLDWYNATYTNNASANALGVITNGYALGYNNETGLAPWQDDFFTAAVGHTAELGFTKAAPLLAWKTKFAISRMVGADVCWIDGSMYAMTVRDTSSSPIYSTIGQAYKASNTAEFNALACNSPQMAASLQVSVGEMVGYSTSPTGYPSNMQAALAFGADVGGKSGTDAWTLFMTRMNKPSYAAQPQFAIVPR
jgi:hypothetical protein